MCTQGWEEILVSDFENDILHELKEYTSDTMFHQF